jgi:hypothetical protein
MLSMLGVSSVYLDVSSVGVKTCYHAKGGLSIIDSRVDCANLVSSSLERPTNKLATRSRSLISVLSADFSRAYIQIGVGSF